MSFNVGSTSLIVFSLERFAAPGDTGTHVVKLVNANGTDLLGGSVSISMANSTPGTFQYANLPGGPVLLQANTTYYLVSQETAGGDPWYDIGSVSTSAVSTVNGPTYTDADGNYVTVAGLGGDSYVPVNFLYGPVSVDLSATIASPQNGATLSGSVLVSVSTFGFVFSYQLQVDGVNLGSPSSVTPITLDTTQLSNGQHTLAVVVSNGSTTATSTGITVTTANNTTVSNTSFVTSQTASTLRYDTAFVGMSFTVGATPISVVSLGRYVVPGDAGAHTIKLVQSNGQAVINGSVALSLKGATAGQYAYALLPVPVTLAANTSYYLVSQEGSDAWYDLEPVTTTGVAQVTGPTYIDGHGNYVTVAGLPGYSYVPVSFQYQ